MPGAELGQLTRMTEQSDHQPTLERLRDQRALFDHLSDFQESLTLAPLVSPRLPDVLRAAQPAFEVGFAYSASMWQGKLQVTLHWGSAELGSCALVEPANYSDTCARLLAGLLGIPLCEGDQPAEPEVCASLPADEEAAPMADVPEAAAEADEADEEFDDGLDGSPSQLTTPDTQRELTAQERSTAIDMIKQMEPAQRKAFTKAFRELFQVPADAKQISPHITRLEHWLFIDRYTVEAAGGVAA